ncbi:Succinylornithine transaminase/acetylornithine aminotransferase [invertebrate metagenome]|uniref:Succinylornithine transaminase/acetylornithine aminotransferase n=1 Tax=invertebrate metagenome TaxID=1711999 RepID=A0A2H9T756_9ZZZZ
MMEHFVNRKTFDDVMVPNYMPQSIIPVKGKGAHVWDQQGREYIDFSGGIAVNALGHCHPQLLRVLQYQSKRLWHLSNVYTNEPALSLAKKLIECTFADKVFFCNSGTEANEAAFKLARKYAYDNTGPEKHEIIGFTSAFHGRSLFTVSVGGQKKYREGFAPTPKGITHVPFNDISALEAAISDKTCAVVMEPIQGEGGIFPADDDFLKAVRKLCDQYNALLVFDEIQTGMGRTGHLFAYMDTEVVPDIMTSAKALGAGFPIAAMLATDKVARSLGLGTHGSTYGGNPLACSVALETLNIINREDLLANVTRKHTLFRKKLERINEKYSLFKEIRGKGLLIGAELNPPWHGRAKEFLSAGIRHGVMLLIAGPNIIRMTPPLIIPDKDIKTGMKYLEQAVAEIYDENK